MPACLNNHMSNKLYNKITYPFPNVNGSSIEVSEWIGNFIPHFIKYVITYPYC